LGDPTSNTSYSDFTSASNLFYYKVLTIKNGEYSGDSNINSGYIKVVTPTLLAIPSSLSFTAVVGGTNPTAQNVSLSGVQTLSWTPTKTQSGLTVTKLPAGSYGVSAAINISGLAAGTYTDNIKITASGASNSPITIPVTLIISAAPSTTDTTPPSQPVVTATAVSSSQIDLLWTASTDASGIQQYSVFRGSTWINTTNGNVTSLSDTGLSPSTRYCYTVRAVDKANNVSGDSALVCTTTQASAGVTTTNVVSDTTWQSSSTAPSGWTLASYDDTSWTAAIEQTGGYCGAATKFIANTTAKYMWHVTNQYSSSANAYFRKSFTLSQTSTNATVYIFADNGYELYINGTLVHTNANSLVNGSSTADSINVDSYLTIGTNVIAVHGMNPGCAAMILVDLKFN